MRLFRVVSSQENESLVLAESESRAAELAWERWQAEDIRTLDPYGTTVEELRADFGEEWVSDSRHGWST